MSARQGCYCKACGYDLTGLARDHHACPECSVAFDPADPATYDALPRGTRRRRLARRLAVTAALLAIVIAFLPRGYAVGHLTVVTGPGPGVTVSRVMLAPPDWVHNATGADYPAWNWSTSAPSGPVAFKFQANNYRLTLRGLAPRGMCSSNGSLISPVQIEINGVPVDLDNPAPAFDTVLPDMVAQRGFGISVRLKPAAASVPTTGR